MTDLPSQFQILFATFPPPAGDVAAQLSAYAVAIEGHDPRDIDAAVKRFLRGEVPGHNPAFAPSAALVGSAVRQCMNDRLDSERRARKPALPKPDVEKSPESRERVKALAAQFIGTVESMRTKDAKASRRSTDRHDAFFGVRPGITVGDPDGDRDVA